MSMGSGSKSNFRVIMQSPVFWLGCVAAIAYSSWPLGFILDPFVSHHELASMLEAPHEPYNWLFVTTDVMTGIAISIMAVRQFTRLHLNRKTVVTISGYWLFGLLVGVAAMTPLRCDPEARQCGPLLHNPTILIHGLASIGSSVALLVSLLVLGAVILKQQTSLKIQLAYALLLCNWLLFGIGALVELVLRIKGNSLQYYFITVCSLTVIVVGLLLETYGQQPVTKNNFGTVTDLEATESSIQE